MTNKISILLIEDDANACDEIRNYIEGLEDVSLIGTTNNANKALGMVPVLLPDVVILDLELHQGGGNGLLFLLGLNQLELEIRPYILITTHNVSDITFESARQLGADFILAKYEKDYSAQYVVEFVRMMKETILMRNNRMTAPAPLSPQEREHFLTQRIQREMNRIGVSPKSIGLQYLVDAILLTIESPEPNLSKTLALKYHKTDSSIERAMQNAINRTWRCSDPEDLLANYTARVRSDRGVPTLMEFISYYATKIKAELD